MYKWMNRLMNTTYCMIAHVHPCIRWYFRQNIWEIIQIWLTVWLSRNMIPPTEHGCFWAPKVPYLSQEPRLSNSHHFLVWKLHFWHIMTYNSALFMLYIAVIGLNNDSNMCPVTLGQGQGHSKVITEWPRLMILDKQGCQSESLAWWYYAKNSFCPVGPIRAPFPRQSS